MKKILFIIHFFYINKEQVSKLTPELTNKIICNDTIVDIIETLKTRFVKLIDKKVWNILVNEITGISKVIKKKVRIVDPSKREAWIINEVEKQIQSLDIKQEQIKIGQQIPLGP